MTGWNLPPGVTTAMIDRQLGADGPDSQMLRETHVKRTKKVHFCRWCRKEIPVGSEAISVAELEDGEFIAYYVCIRCQGGYYEY